MLYTCSNSNYPEGSVALYCCLTIIKPLLVSCHSLCDYDNVCTLINLACWGIYIIAFIFSCVENVLLHTCTCHWLIIRLSLSILITQQLHCATESVGYCLQPRFYSVKKPFGMLLPLMIMHYIHQISKYCGALTTYILSLPLVLKLLCLSITRWTQTRIWPTREELCCL